MTTALKLKSLHLRFTEAIAEFYHGEWTTTGTRKGMNARQLINMRRILSAGAPLVLRHGGAHGSDTEVHAMWRELELPLADVWPASEDRAKLFRHQQNVIVHSVMDPLVRNGEMVKRSVLTVATPHTNKEERSGTWNTIHTAMTLKQATIIVWPNGQLTLYFQDSLKRLSFDE